MLTAPLDMKNAFGQGMHHRDLALKLLACNPAFEIPLPESCPWWYPGKKAGMTSIWIGEPFKPTSKKICAFHLGMLPEFTQIDDAGNIIRRGWRSILSKCIKSKAVTKRKVRTIFKTGVDYEGFDGACVRCRREGTLKRGSPKDGLCELHRMMDDLSSRITEGKKEGKWLKEQSPDRQKKHSSPQLRPMVVLGR
jgi:hypothetical protein